MNEIHKHTPEGHPDFEDVSQAYELSEATADLINTEARTREDQAKLEDIARSIDFSEAVCPLILNSKGVPNFRLNGKTKFLGTRKYIYDATVEKKKNGKKIKLFLFSDLLLLCIKKTSGSLYLLYRPVCVVFSYPIAISSSGC